METVDIAIIGTQGIALLVYRWVMRNYYSQPKHNHPSIFWNKTSRMLLCNGPTIVIVTMVILAFFTIEYPWWFLFISFILVMIFTSNPNKGN